MFIVILTNKTNNKLNDDSILMYPTVLGKNNDKKQFMYLFCYLSKRYRQLEIESTQPILSIVETLIQTFSISILVN